MAIAREGDSVTEKPRRSGRRRSANMPHAIPAACGLIALWLAVLAGCTSIPQVPTEHIVMVNGRGNPVDPTGNILCADEPAPCNGSHFWLTEYHEMERSLYKTYLSSLFEAMRDAPESNGKKQLLIFIHGGMNTQVGTIERAADLHESIEAAGYFPIFVNWQSSLVSSYRDHLLYIRQGQDRGTWGMLLAPFYLLTDVTRSVARAPVVLWSLFRNNDIQTWPLVKRPSETDETRIADDVKKEVVIDLARGDDTRDKTEKTLSTLSWIFTAPTKLLIAPFLDAFGKSAWDIMLRRTDLLYHTDGEFTTESDVAMDAHKNKGGYQYVQADGGLSVFMRGLQDQIAQNGGPDKWDITLVGHSMGTIVLNRLIRDFGTFPPGTMPFKTMPFNRIVYMAAAATVKDYEDSIFPYLAKNEHAEFYHLTLHALAEARDRLDKPIRYVDFPPRGSLLVWVDEFLANPGTLHDRTVGRFTNLTVALHDTPEELRGRIHIKEFNVGASFRDTDPQKHGDFTDPFTFWKQECWQPKSPSSPACFPRK